MSTLVWIHLDSSIPDLCDTHPGRILKAFSELLQKQWWIFFPPLPSSSPRDSKESISDIGPVSEVFGKSFFCQVGGWSWHEALSLSFSHLSTLPVLPPSLCWVQRFFLSESFSSPVLSSCLLTWNSVSFFFLCKVQGSRPAPLCEVPWDHIWCELAPI